MAEKNQKCEADPSCFHVHLKGGQIRDSHAHSWRDMSQQRIVKRKDGKFHTHVSKYYVDSLEVKHEGLEMKLDFQKGEYAYQSIQAMRVLSNQPSSAPTILGRTIGKIKDNKVSEEYFLDGINKSIERTV